MNSDTDSDWDSMSEAPPTTNNKSIDVIDKYPPPLTNNPETRSKINSQQYSKSHTQQTQNYDKESAKIIAQQAAVKHHSRYNQQNMEQRVQDVNVQGMPKSSTKKEPLNDKAKLPISAKRMQSSKDSGIDTDTVCSSNVTLDTVRVDIDKNDHKIELKANIPTEGIPNKGYDDDSDDSTIENNLAQHNFKKYPDPEERINLLQLQELKTKYFQVEFESEGLLVDKAIPSIVFCCTTVSAEVLGLLKIPLVIIFVFIGQIVRVLTSSILRPFSDYIFKPLLVSLHNLILSPLFSLLYNISSMVATTLSPCCNINKYHPLWNYREHKDQQISV